MHIADAFRWYAEKRSIHVGAFVVMPDHWHLLMHSERDVSEFVGMAAHWISRQTGTVLRAAGVDWQDGFHETRIRSVRQFQFVRHYIEENPVTKELAEMAGGWQWSSASDKYKDIVPLSWPFEFEEE
jgi:REP element-mobilizing transposase RayT